MVREALQPGDLMPQKRVSDRPVWELWKQDNLEVVVEPVFVPEGVAGGGEVFLLFSANKMTRHEHSITTIC